MNIVMSAWLILTFGAVSIVEAADKKIVWQHSGKNVEGKPVEIEAFQVVVVRPGEKPDVSSPVRRVETKEKTLTIGGLEDGPYDIYVRARGKSLWSDWCPPIRVVVETVIVEVTPEPPFGLGVQK